MSKKNGKEYKDKFTMLTEAPVKGLVTKLAIPTIFSMMVTAFYNMADTFFVGTLGTSETGAVGIVFSVMAIIQAIGFFFGHGSGNYISRQLGAKKEDDAYKMAATAFVTAFLFGVVLACVGLLLIEPLAYGLGSTKSILPFAKQYMKWILIGTPFIISSFVLNNQLRFQGNAFYGMIGITSGAVLNVILDPVLIIVCNLGVQGAGIATMCSQALSFFILFVMCKKKSSVPIELKNVKPCFEVYKEIIRGGLPSLCRQGLNSIAVICLNHMAGPYGDAAIAAMSIVTRINMFASSAVIGFGQGFQPVCGFNYGAKKYERVREAFWFSVKVCVTFLLLASAVGIVESKELVTLFRKDDMDVINIGSEALIYQCLAMPLMGFMMPSNMMIQTIGKAGKATILAMGRQFIFYLPTLFILVPTLGLLGIKITQPIADVLTFFMTVPIVFSVLAEFRRAKGA